MLLRVLYGGAGTGETPTGLAMAAKATVTIV